MFIRKVINSKGIAYLQIAETYREGSRVRQRILFSLGRLDKLRATGEIDNITRALSRYCERLFLVDLSKDISVEETYVYGSVYLLSKLFERTRLRAIVEEVAGFHSEMQMPFVSSVFAMVISRFVRPCSKLSLKSKWLDRLYPELVSEGMELHHLYRALDILADHKDDIQKRLLYPSSQYSLFHAPKLELVFYDTTTLRFESVRDDLGELRRFGYSKERRTDCTQVILGLMLDREGLPVGYRLFPGNTYEGKTLPVILNSLKKDYQIQRLIFVADRGMLNNGNLNEIKKAGFEFIIGMKLWSMTEKEKKKILHLERWDYQTEYLRVADIPHPEGRLIVTWSHDRAHRDHKARTDLLEKLKSRLQREDDPSSLITHKGFKRYLKVVSKGKVVIDDQVVREETARDGLFGILTNVSIEELPSTEIVRRYKELWKIEDAFGEIKGTLEARPMFHWTDKRIEGHMMVCFLAYYLEAYVARQLKNANADFSAVSAFDVLNQVRAIPVSVRGKKVWVRTKIDGIAARAMKILKIQIPSDVLRLPTRE